MQMKHKSRNLYRVLSYMSRRGYYPDGIDRQKVESRFDKDIVSELCYYNYLEGTSKDALRITVQGREALKVHVLTVVNVLTALLALVVAVLALFLQ